MATAEAARLASNGRAPGTLDTGQLSEGMVWERQFSPTEDPYESIPTAQRDVVLKNAKTDEITFEQRGITVPEEWDKYATDIFAQHYLRGPLGAPERENSVFQSVGRVSSTIRCWAMEGRRMPDGEHRFLGSLFRDEVSATAWEADLAWLMATQHVVFNSPVWYNIGVKVYNKELDVYVEIPQQCSACFILASDRDSMERIADWFREEIRIFKGGSGSGINVSGIRSSFEGLSGGGMASGPCSYMRGADASAGTMKSGGRSRRAAKMVVMNCDHPDLIVQADGSEGFIWLKSKAEKIAHALKKEGFDVSVESGLDAIHVQYQNANNSVRYTNEFMEALLADEEWHFKPRRPDLLKKKLPVFKTREIWEQHAQASWECADPGIQFDTTINHWHTTPAAGRINGSNPCSEYMHLDSSPCNLANTNLIKFIRGDGGWDTERFTAACRVLAIAQTVLAAYGDYPTDDIASVARGFRQIGQGYTNLGALVMLRGLPYDSPEARTWGAVITSQMQAAVSATSAEIASVWGAYPGVPELGLPGFDNEVNQKAHLKVVAMHADFNRAIAKSPTRDARRRSLKFGDEIHIDVFHTEVVEGGKAVQHDPHLRQAWEEANGLWQRSLALGEQYGYANAYWSNIPPMGTSGIVLGQTTSGLEPIYGQKVTKKKVSGDFMQIVNQLLVPTLVGLGYTAEQAIEIEQYVDLQNSVVGAPHLAEEHYPVFDAANAEPIDGRHLSVEAHILMMGAVQPFLSGAISKTINLPKQATVADFEKAHLQLWRTGNKAGALYRDESKATQPLVTEEGVSLGGPPPTVRHKLPRRIRSERVKLSIPQPGMESFEFYMQVGFYPDGKLGELFLTAGNEGTTINGLIAGAVKWGSLGSQHGVPAEALIRMWLGMKFEPHGNLSPQDSEFTSCTSPYDLAAKELALLVLSDEQRHALGIYTREERKLMVKGEPLPTVTSANGSGQGEAAPQAAAERTAFTDAKFCYATTCGGIRMDKIQGCWVCPNCGGTDGCS
jgi:ribonucleoside-diphosphate reductase alpha chain